MTILQLPRDTLTKATTVEETFDWVLAYSLSGLVRHHHSGEHGGRRGAGEVAESSTLILRQQEERDTGSARGFWSLKAYPPVTHFL